VTLTLQAAAPGSPLRSLAQAASAVSPLPVGNSRVLVVDDHPVNREVLVRQLDLLGIAADTADDGAEGLAAWESGTYAAVLADIHMPRLDGYGLVQRIRAVEAGRGGARTPVVAVTANALKGEEERCLALGMDAYITKPISMARLRHTLERWLTIGGKAAEASPTGSAPASSPIDPAVLGTWLGSDLEAISALLRKFARTAAETESEIRSAVCIGDLAAAAAAAHKLNGAARTVGANGVAKAAAGIERAGKAGDKAGCSDALGPLAAELRCTAAAINEQLPPQSLGGTNI
jgi:CheY-like chemotaxis protein/HPt (histidine-containing phosphotransfer) domain-containing protein